MSYYDCEFAPGALEVKVSDLLIATPDYCDPLIDPGVHQVLKLLREQQGMDAAFACEVVDGQRVAHRSPTLRAQFIDEQAEPLEMAFCRQVLNARVPAGCYLSAPVVVNGGVYGTLYSFSFNPDPAIEARDLKKLEMAAQLAARLVGERRPRTAAPVAQGTAAQVQHRTEARAA
ncbi:hypothetical protein VAR608DRAFT_4472 [Variovorax sp. HW608]|uniref:hypothetical protein n=1 Tax=Variovorax sp. HW608 TaxID=1034889 RepID=UPI00081F96A5|nr:hypothetical protein [Variovorax sp. HW608]SCK45742.1 hypothetical protein VAR608DRAFT_4472 [Variovorax sp. HW608]